MFTQHIELHGHIIDSLILPKVLDQILAHGGIFKIEEVRRGLQMPHFVCSATGVSKFPGFSDLYIRWKIGPAWSNSNLEPNSGCGLTAKNERHLPK